MKAPNKRLRKAALYLLTPITGSLVGAGVGYYIGAHTPERLTSEANSLQMCVDAIDHFSYEAGMQCPDVLARIGMQGEDLQNLTDTQIGALVAEIKSRREEASRLGQEIPKNIFQGTAAGFLVSTGAILLDMRRPDSAPPVQAQQVTS